MKFPEDIFQMQVAQYLHLQYPNLLWWHTANERKTSPQAGARLKKKGVRAGVADILIFSGGEKYAIELKCGKNTLSPHQERFANDWQNEGGHIVTCYNLDEVISALVKWKIRG
jgi:hypothetical protein